MKSVETSERIKYIENELVLETDLMKKIAYELEKDQKAIQVAPFEGKILSQLIKMRNPKNVVEIGTLYGYSLNWILEGVSDEAKVWSVENSAENFDKSIRFINVHNKQAQVSVKNQSGLEFFDEWPENSKIDFLFIDADKGNYLNYLNLAKPSLSKGAVVVGDNTFLFGHVLNDEPPEKYSKNTWKHMREFNQVLNGSTGEFSGMMIPTLQGLTVGIKN